MARPAADARRLPQFGLGQLLAPSPGRLEFAARLALICALTTLVVVWYGTPEPALTVYVVFFLNRRDRVSSLLLNVAMVLVLTLVIGVVLLVAQLVLDHPPWRVASMALLSFGLLFLVSASKLGQAGATLALIAAYALDVLGKVPAGELATRGLLYAWLFVAIPAGLSMVINLLFAPAPRQLAQRELARRLRAAAAWLKRGDAPAATAVAQCVQRGDSDVRTWLRLAGLERSSPPADLAALRQATGSATALLLQADFMARTPQAAPSPAQR